MSILLSLIILGYLLRLTKLIYTNNIRNQKHELLNYEVNNQGISKGDKIPDITIINSDNNKQFLKSNPVFHNTILILTGVGCGECLKLLREISIYDFDNIDQNIVILTFIPPMEMPEEIIESHFNVLNKLSNFKGYVISEEALNQLKFSQFPLIIPVDRDGNSRGTFHGDDKVFASIANFKNESQELKEVI